MPLSAPPGLRTFTRTLVPSSSIVDGRRAGIGGVAFSARTVGFVLTAAAFALLFYEPAATLFRDWLNLPEASHGLLLAPVSVWLAWRRGIRPDAAPDRVSGLLLLGFAVLVRYLSALAAEPFTMAGSMILALLALVVYNFGFRQILSWWLPVLLLCLCVPLPELIVQAIALPLQFRASRMGAALLQMRNVPVLLAGNVIRLPGQELFVTEACSGLRSLTALISLGVLLGGIVLRTPLARVLIIALAIPIAIVINGVRVFLTGFLVYFVSPALGQGFMHLTEGWLLFLVSFGSLALLAWAASLGERFWFARRASHA